MRFFAAVLLAIHLLCGAVEAANLTTTSVQAAGTDWNAAIWKTNGTGTSVSPIAGNTYATIFNGTSIGNGLANTRIRNPAAATIQTFFGDSLTLNTNTELRAKGKLRRRDQTAQTETRGSAGGSEEPIEGRTPCLV